MSVKSGCNLPKDMNERISDHLSHLCEHIGKCNPDKITRFTWIDAKARDPPIRSLSSPQCPHVISACNSLDCRLNTDCSPCLPVTSTV